VPSRRIATLLLASGLLMLGCSEKSQDTVQSQRARNWLEADPSAISTAEEAHEPAVLPETHYAAGRLFESQGQLEKAIIQYRKAVAVHHKYVEAYNRLGIVLGQVGRHEEAEAALRQAVILQPDGAYLRNNLGFGYALQGRWSDAEAELSNAIRLDPSFARAWVNLGMVLARQHRYEEALDAFRTAVPEADAFYNLGLMFRLEHRYSDAADAFRHVLALNPQFGAAQVQLDEIGPQLALSSPLEPMTEMGQEKVTQANQVDQTEPADATAVATVPPATESVGEPSEPAEGQPAIAASELESDAGASMGAMRASTEETEADFAEQTVETVATPDGVEMDYVVSLTGAETAMPVDETIEGNDGTAAESVPMDGAEIVGPPCPDEWGLEAGSEPSADDPDQPVENENVVGMTVLSVDDMMDDVAPPIEEAGVALVSVATPYGPMTTLDADSVESPEPFLSMPEAEVVSMSMADDFMPAGDDAAADNDPMADTVELTGSATIVPEEVPGDSDMSMDDESAATDGMGENAQPCPDEADFAAMFDSESGVPVMADEPSEDVAEHAFEPSGEADLAVVTPVAVLAPIESSDITSDEVAAQETTATGPETEFDPRLSKEELVAMLAHPLERVSVEPDSPFRGATVVIDWPRQDQAAMIEATPAGKATADAAPPSESSETIVEPSDATGQVGEVQQNPEQPVKEVQEDDSSDAHPVLHDDASAATEMWTYDPAVAVADIAPPAPQQMTAKEVQEDEEIEPASTPMTPLDAEAFANAVMQRVTPPEEQTALPFPRGSVAADETDWPAVVDRSTPVDDQGDRIEAVASTDGMIADAVGADMDPCINDVPMTEFPMSDTPVVVWAGMNDWLRHVVVWLTSPISFSTESSRAALTASAEIIEDPDEADSTSGVETEMPNADDGELDPADCDAVGVGLPTGPELSMDESVVPMP